MISRLGLPHEVVFLEIERCARVQVAVKADEVGHCGHGVVEHDVHVSAVDLGDEIPPVLNCTVMAIQEGQIQGSKAIAGPGPIEERASSQVECLSDFDAFSFALTMGREIGPTLIPRP